MQTLKFIIYFVFSGRCPDVDCNSTTSALSPRARALQDPQADALSQSADDGALMASYSVFVVEPGEQVGKYNKNNMTCIIS